MRAASVVVMLLRSAPELTVGQPPVNSTPPGADVDASTRKDSAHLAAGKVQFKSQRRTDPLESYLVTANGLVDLFSSPGGSAAGATAITQPKAKKQRSR